MLYEIKNIIGLIRGNGDLKQILSQQKKMEVIQNKILEIQQDLANRMDMLEKRNSDMKSANEAFYRDYMQQLYEFEEKWQMDIFSRYDDIDVKNYKKEHITKVRQLFRIHSLVDEDHILRRYGNFGDGGYIMANNIENCRIAYSFGINDDVSWDECMAECGIDIYMYDHTINRVPKKNKYFHWKKIGITGVMDNANSDLKTLEMLIAENGHIDEQNMILKIDVEGAEWSVMANTPSKILNKFSQIIVEFHDLNCIDNECQMVTALKNLQITHAPVHLHGNNFKSYQMYGGQMLPDVLECLFLNKSQYKLTPCKKFFPCNLDNANCEGKPDIILGIWGE